MEEVGAELRALSPVDPSGDVAAVIRHLYLITDQHTDVGELTAPRSSVWRQAVRHLTRHAAPSSLPRGTLMVRVPFPSLRCPRVPLHQKRPRAITRPNPWSRFADTPLPHRSGPSGPDREGTLLSLDEGWAEILWDDGLCNCTPIIMLQLRHGYPASEEDLCLIG